QLIDGHTIYVDVTGTITDIGEEINTFDYQILDEALNDVSSYYAVDDNEGKLEIIPEKIPLTIISESDSKTYDGTPLTNEEWELYDSQVLPDHTLTVHVNGSITDIGSTENTFTYMITDEFGIDVSMEYEVESLYGLLMVFGEDGNGLNKENENQITNELNLGGSGLMLPLFRVFSEEGDLIYLRDKSYGDYNKTGWDVPPVYFSPYGISPLNFPSLAGNELTTNQLELKALTTNLPYFLPYYATNGYYDNINDVYLSHSYGGGYTINYLPINDLDYESNTLVGTEYESMENAYKEHVYDTYLQLPQETRIALLEIASKNGLDATSETLIEDVKNYIQKSGVYNLEYGPIPNNVDFAIYFLEESNEGICQHFAMAATVMYRALGIPARYVTGFSVYAVEDEWTDVTPMQAHAWTEIYIDGFGWVPIETTPGGSGGNGGMGGASGEGDGNGEGSGEGAGVGAGIGAGGEGITIDSPTCESTIDCEELDLISIKSGNASKVYDGNALSNNFTFYEGKLKDGHTLSIDSFASITQVGEVYNTFEAVILDQDGNDVSDEYRIRKVYGLLVVMPNNDKPILEIQLYDNKTVYNGERFIPKETDYFIPSRNLPSNYTVSFDIIGSLKNAGYIQTSIDRSSFRIYDEFNIDVTNNYNIVFYNGSVEVLKRNLTLSTYSVEKYYDGTPLISDDYYISQGSKVSGHDIEVTITGSQTEIGSSKNTFSEITIFDQTGNDVTSNYYIKTSPGTLVVLEE
ncbi:MAG: transglutaminase domain-containing protein, partial [Candidatus Izemoplasmataceae bacterium]